MNENAKTERFKHWGKRLMLAAVGLLCLLFLLVYILLGTHIGSIWIVAAVNKFEPRFNVTLERGILLGDATLSNLTWSSPGVDVRVPHVDWSWDLSCLRDNGLCLDRLRTQMASVTLTADPTISENASLEETDALILPFTIALRGVQLQQTRLDLYGHDIALDDLQGAARFDREGLHLQSMKLRDLLVKIATTPPPEAGEVLKTTPLVLPEIKLPFPIHINALELRSAHLSLPNSEHPLDQLQLTAGVAGSKVDLTRILLASPEASLQTSGRIDLNADYPLELLAEIELLELPPVTGLNAKLVATGSVADLAVELSAHGPVTGALSARAKLLDPTLPFSADLFWSDFGWPIEQPTLFSESGSASFSGTLDGYSFELTGDAHGAQFPELVLEAHGRGNEQQLELSAMTLQALDGEATLTGAMSWNNGLLWQGELRLEQINPAELVTELPGCLSGRIENRLRLEGEEWTLTLPNIALEGELSDQPLRLYGSIEGSQSGDWQFDQLQLHSGKNSVQVDGQFGVNSNLSGQVELIDLQTSFPQVTGSATGTVNLSGPLEALRLDISLSANDLSYAGQKLGTLAAGGELNFNTKEQGWIPRGSLQIQAEQLVYQNFSFSLIDAHYSGNDVTQSLSLDLQGEKFSLQSSLEGRLEEKIWSGQLLPSRLETPLGDWQLSDPLELRYEIEQQQATVDRHCWSSEAASLCLNETARIGRDGFLDISLKDLEHTQLAGLMPEELVWQGRLDANASAAWSPDQKPVIKVDLNAGSGRFDLTQTGQTVHADYQRLELRADLDQSRAQATLALRSEQLGDADVNLLLPLDQEEALQSEFHLSGLQLNLLRPLLDPLQEIAGTIDADGKISGNLQQPQINGQIKLSAGRLIDASLPSDIEQLNLLIKLDGYQSILNGDMLLGSGRTELAGAFSWAQQPLSGWLNLKGERNRVSYEPELKLLISPDLRFEFLENKLSLTGSILVPYGRTRIRTLPQGAVRVTEDVVILDKPQIKRAGLGLRLALDVEVTLQEDVEIDAFGLKAKLGGGLVLRQTPDRPLSGNGSIDLRDGTYRAFGQNLLIKKGMLLFSGPLSKPFLDVDAIRNPNATSDNVIAGIQLRGRAQNPKVTICSEPAMAQQEAISYLLRGRSLGSSSGSSQDTMVATMLIGAGIGQTEGVIGELGETFGVKDMAVDTSGEGSDTQVKVTGYVLPGVQIGYGVGVFSPVTTITLRYEILPKLILEAVSGIRTAADLLYEFEF